MDQFDFDRLGDSLGILPPVNTQQTWNGGPQYTSSSQGNPPPLYTQATSRSGLNQLMAGYIGANFAQNSYNPPAPPRLPDPYRPVVTSQEADGLSSKRKRRRLPYTYDGNGELEAFTFIAIYHQVTHHDNWPDHEKVTYFSDHLTGKALQWYTMQFSVFTLIIQALDENF